MKITRLRLLGFKSFVEPTELLIEPGLTGVVGPNGCGKSNLLEALRWVMGETSFKTMRASAMDDVIFAGTQNRPARNMAEVSIFIDNSERTAPAEFNDSDLLEVSRRIERDAGSAYKINGKDARARDVRLLFEDAATGARSPALVRQGRIGEIVNSKPQDRRRVLEDAAGIAGLHSRRHEAELRLKATEGNLERLQDLMGQMTSQLNSLKRQARQARRYKEVSHEIRQKEALQHHIYWSAACAQVENAEGELQEAVRTLGEATRKEAEALRSQTQASDALQPLRDEESIRAAVLQRLTVERDTLDTEEERMQARLEELEERREQLQRDIEREKDNITESEETIRRLDEEEGTLTSLSGDDGAADAARAAAEEKADVLAEAEERLGELKSRLAEARAQRSQLESEAGKLASRMAQLEAQKQDSAEKLDALKAERGADTEITVLEDTVAGRAQAFEKAERAAEEAKAAHAKARAEENEIREAATAARLKAQELETEVQTLTKLLKPDEAAEWLPIVQDVRAQPGYELALGAALGDDLDASADSSAPAHWGTSDAADDPALPAGTQPLGQFVNAPGVLARRLAQIGVVDPGNGDRLQGELKPGQRLVSTRGDLWRWDGYTAMAEAPTAAAKRLKERNRLDELMSQSVEAKRTADEAGEKLTAIRETVAQAEQAETETHRLRREAQTALDEARTGLKQAEAAARESNEAYGALSEALKHASADLDAVHGSHAEALAALAALENEDTLEKDVEERSQEVAEKRAAYMEARSTFEGMEREVKLRQARLESIAQDRQRWANRKQSAGQQIETLENRLEETRDELSGFDDLPERIAERRSKLLDEISKAEQQRQEAADALAEADTTRRACDEAMREAQDVLSTARENRARIEAQLEAARERRSDQVRLIAENLDCAPDACLELAGLEPDSELPPIDTIETALAKLKQDRERLGGVNLRAEEEVEEIATELEAMTTEQSDLEEAITKLRQGISNLNREGRKRLLEAFDDVNEHFQRLFKTLFGGGEAELQLIESDDPLNSGLEILARPPGKKPQVLTLLSGGEKALTAMALIFAVFLTNPSPICVLDEVDAPLDDTNVERFCQMMDEMARTTDTRFLIITHHPMTMARVNRLFGVTMAERGVSQLVSVDLEEAERFRDTG